MRNDAPLTKREIKKAARLFVLISMAFGVDNQGCEDKDEFAMIDEVVRSASDALEKEFPTVMEHPPMTQALCVAAIKGMRK